MKNLWEIFKNPSNAEHGIYILYVPSIFFIFNIFIGNLYVSLFAWFLLLTLNYNFYKRNSKWYRNLFKKDIWVRVHKPNAHWVRIDRSYINKKNNLWEINIKEVFSEYETYSSTTFDINKIPFHDIDIFFNTEEFSYPSGIVLKNTDSEVFRGNKREDSINNLLEDL